MSALRSTTLSVLNKNTRGVAASQLSYWDDNHGCHIEVLLSDNVKCGAAGSDYFEAFRALRLQMEKQRLYPLCQGSKKDVHPSGMCRDMGGGLCAYQLHVGRKTSMQDLVNIFDPCEAGEAATVEEQDRFYEQYLGTA